MNIVAICIAKWDEQNDIKIIQFENCSGLLTRKHGSEFSFQQPKTIFKLDNFGVILFASFAIKIATMFTLWKLKKSMQKSIFLQKIQKSLCITTKSMNNFKRNYLENYNDSKDSIKTKNAPFFMNFSNINKMATFFPLDWSFKPTVEKCVA